jgi:hypothetical protein
LLDILCKALSGASSECGGRAALFLDVEQPAMPTTKKKSSFGFMECFGAIVILGFILSDCFSGHKSDESRRLSVPDGGTVAVAVTRQDLDSLVRSAQYNTPNYGGVFYVASDTKVSILRAGVASTEVYVIDGPGAGRSGWVPSEWVK